MQDIYMGEHPHSGKADGPSQGMSGSQSRTGAGTLSDADYKWLSEWWMGQPVRVRRKAHAWAQEHGLDRLSQLREHPALYDEWFWNCMTRISE